MSALDTWTIDAVVVRRIRSIFRETPAPAEAPQPPPPGALQPDESGDVPVPVHIWKQFHTVLARILTPHEAVLDALIAAIKEDPILSKGLSVAH